MRRWGPEIISWMDEVRLSDTVLAPSPFLRASLVPEPSSAAMLLLGALALCRRR
jgi:PEP-CTERM motif